MQTLTRSTELARRAAAVTPGSANSSNRVVPWPFVVTGAQGARFTDADGNRYLDYHAAYGAIVLGHAHPRVNGAVKAAIDRVDIIGAGISELEIELAETIIDHVPSAERVLLANSGSEATFAALRVARAATGRTAILKFQGTYHGWHDSVAMNLMSRPEMLGRRDPLSLGMLPEAMERTVVVPWNDEEAVADALAHHPDGIAAIILEPLPHNIGCVPARPGFLAKVRELATIHGCVLIFDEVITGFRHSLGGYQSVVGVTPDLSTFAKAMANGFPIAALAGKAELMDRFQPGGGVTFMGTYNGHPVGVAAALATIVELEDGRVHEHAFRLTARVAEGISRIAQELGITMTVARFGSIFVPYFMEGTIERYDDLLRNDTQRDIWFRRTMSERGVFMMPLPLRRNCVSAAHTDDDIDRTLEVARDVLRALPA